MRRSRGALLLIALVAAAGLVTGCVESSEEEAQTPAGASTVANSALQTDSEGNTVTAPAATAPAGGGGGETTGGGGSTEPLTCDATEGCQACANSYCASERCSAQQAACDGDSACVSFRDCYWQCAADDYACSSTCMMKHMAGVEKYNAWMECKWCANDTCGSSCEPMGECAPLPECFACLYSADALTACTSQYVECVGNAGCVELDACLSSCSSNMDQPCIDACFNAAPASAEIDYDNFWGCMHCEAAACASECSAQWGAC